MADEPADQTRPGRGATSPSTERSRPSAQPTAGEHVEGDFSVPDGYSVLEGAPPAAAARSGSSSAASTAP